MRRCPAFHYCARCHMCANFNIHNEMCNRCEERKAPKRYCKCTPAERHALIQVEKITNKPLWDPNNAERGEVLIQTDHTPINQDMVQAIKEMKSAGQE
jgi:hypothetical protein